MAMDPKTRFFNRMEADLAGQEGPQSDIDIDFSVTESGRTVAHIVEGSSFDPKAPLDDIDIAITSSARTNSERSTRAKAPISTEHSESQLPAQLESKASQNHTSQPATRSMPRPIPNEMMKNPPPAAQSQSGGRSRSSSLGSTGSNFMSSILGIPVGGQLSHTPPTQQATSYEASHFGKRARSGSVSERLRFTTDMEAKGLIDQETKGILKDLIISGDNELQSAIDKYEQGDPSELEALLKDGRLSSKVVNEIDLLGDLDLDFLTMDDGGVNHAAQHVNSNGQPITVPAAAKIMPSAPAAATNGPRKNSLAPSLNDGIGDLEFGGDLVGTLADGDGGRSRSNSVFTLDQSMFNDMRSRSNSTWSVNEPQTRSRSNSLFSALIGVASQQQEQESDTNKDYGKWMEGSSGVPGAAVAPQDKPVKIGALSKMSKRTLPSNGRSNLSRLLDAHEMTSDTEIYEDSKMSPKEVRAEEKRREKQRQKEVKERLKREKKLKRDKVKAEKEREKQKKAKLQQQVEEEEKYVHVPGSGRPRSLSDPLMESTIGEDGLLQVKRPKDWVGAYSPESRKVRIQRFIEKRNHRVWTKTVKYDVRKNFADSRLRVKGRFVKKEDELLMRELMSLT